MFCNQTPKIRERIRLRQLFILNELATRSAVLFMRVDNFVTVKGMWYVKSFRILSRKKYKTCMSVHLNTACLISIIFNTCEITPNLPKSMDFTKFLTTICAAKSWNEQCLLLWSHMLLERVLLQYIRRRKVTSCFSRTELQHTVHTTLLLTVPALPCARVHWTGKLDSNNLDLNPVDYSMCRAMQQMVYCIVTKFQTVTTCWTQLNQDRLNWVINQLPNRLMMVIKAKVSM